VVHHRQRLIDAGISETEIKTLEESVADRLDEEMERAHKMSAPSASALFDFVTRERPVIAASPALTGGESEIRTMDAIRTALQAELETDERVFLAGIDVGDGGNVFGLTRGLRERFGDRVRDTPISENAIVGLAVGAAMAGMHPVVEVMYLDFLGVCLDQLLNQAAKLPFMTGGSAEMGLTVRTQFGAGRSSGSQHSQSLEALLAHIPGLTVVMPSTPADTYGLLRAAIQDPNPVVFIENRLLYGMKGPAPPDDYLLPLGQSAVVRPGSDITVVSVSRMVHEAIAAAEEVAGEGISVEVIDLRTVAPLDLAPVFDSLKKTSRILIAHEAVVPFGIGAEIAARVAREAFWDLDAPVERIGAAATPPPYAPELEQAWLPGRQEIAAALRRLSAV
jgi:2-oxoisovalerate dehydrogenase E1 component